MLKMVLFRLANTNIAIIYAIINILITDAVHETDDSVTQADGRYGHIRSVIQAAVITKAIDPVFSRYFFRAAKFWIFKWKYFRQVNKLAQA